AAFNQPKAIEVYKTWQGMVNDGIHPKLSASDAQTAMTSGNLAMYVNTTALLTNLADAARGKYDLRTAGEPGFRDAPARLVNSGSGLFVMTKDPMKLRASWEFLRFMASQRGFTIITSMIGYLPLRDDVVNDPNYLKPFIDKDPRITPTLKQLSDLTPK